MDKPGKKTKDYVTTKLTGNTTSVASRKSRKSQKSRKSRKSKVSVTKTRLSASRPNSWNEGIPRKTRVFPPIKPVVHRPRNMILLVRSGESVRNVFPNFGLECFRAAEQNKLRYHITDINQPLAIPRRPREEFASDPPLTEMGHFTTQALVELLVENKIFIHKIYSAPSFRCVETADVLTDALHSTKIEKKVCVDPAFVEYESKKNIPNYMTPQELSMYGLRVDEFYTPLIKRVPPRKERAQEIYQRVKSVMNNLHKREPIRNPIAIVATPTVIQNISACLCRRKGDLDVPMNRKSAFRISPPSMVQALCYEDKRWRIREDLIPKFDYKYGCNWK